jgi:hypothetical protein
MDRIPAREPWPLSGSPRRQPASELLARFVAAEQPEQSVLLADDAVLRRLVAVWPQARVRWTPGALLSAEAPAWSLWDSLWSCCSVDLDDLAAAMGCETDLAERKVAQAKAARLIRPDGTVGRFAAGVLQALLQKAVGG